MAGLPLRARRALEQLRRIVDDASSAELLAERALAAIDVAVPFDDGALFAVDDTSLLFTRLLAYRGAEPEEMRGWLRDVYLVAAEPGYLHFPTLLERGGGSGTFHEDGDRWLRVLPPPVDPRALRQGWRLWESPPGGVLRAGLPHRRRWVAALQLARLEPGNGFRPGELELIERAAPVLGRGLAARQPDPAPSAERPPPGHLLFDERRRLISVSASAERWLARLPPDAIEPAVPVAVQALVGCLAGSGRADGALTVLDTAGSRVALSAEPALRVDPSSGPEPGYAVTLAAAPLAASDGVTGAQWATAQAVARGDSDREIAEALHVSVATVHEHVAALHRALGTTTRPRLVAALAGTFRSEDRARRGMLTW